MQKNIIFTDGSARGNPGPGGFGAVGLYEEKGEKKVFEVGGGEKMTTNNRMEMKAFIEGLKECLKKNIKGDVLVCTDSAYLMNGVSKWIMGWQRGGWKTKTKSDVLNKDLWQEILLLLPSFKIEWKQIEGHAGIAGNERCDEIATSFADEKNISLYDGSFEKYGIALLSFEKNAALSRPKNSAKAYSYISKVDGKILIHATWKECEARVKGKSNTRFRKSVSKEDEEKIIREFGA